MISFLIYLLILCIVFGLVWWVLSLIPLPPPVKQIVTVVFAVICAIVLIYMLLGLVGPAAHWNWPR
jgi:hypothetical protein